MNYYNPYISMMPYQMITQPASRGLLSRLFGGIKWSSIINGTQKTLGIINQTIPMVKQISPVFKNAKTMFHVMNEFKKVDFPEDTPTVTETVSSSKQTTTTNSYQENISNGNGPVFFI